MRGRTFKGRKYIYYFANKILLQSLLKYFVQNSSSDIRKMVFADAEGRLNEANILEGQQNHTLGR